MKRLAVVLALVSVASADPKVQLGERRFTGGRAITRVAVCGTDRALSVEIYGPRTYEWKLPGGELARTLGALEAEQMFVACEGDVAVTGNFAKTTLYQGGTVVTTAAIKDALGATVARGRAYVFASDGTMFEVSAQGAKVAWKGNESAGLPAVVRADLAVTWDADGLVWSTAAKTTRVPFPAEIVQAADVGDAIAVVDKVGDVRLLTAPKLVAPIAHVDPDALGMMRSIGGNRGWIAVGTYDAKLVQIPRATNKPLAPLELISPRMSRSVNWIAVAGDRWLVATDNNRIVPVPIGARSYTPPKIAGHDDLVWAVALDEKLLVSGSSDDTLRVHRPDGGLVRAIENPESRPFLTVGLASGMLWAHDDYDNLHRYRRAKLQALPIVKSISAAAAIDDKRLAVIQRGVLGILELATGQFRAIPNAPTKLADMKLVAAGGLVAYHSDTFAGPLTIVELTSGKVVAALEVVEVGAMAFSPDASRLAIASDKQLQIWSRKTGKVTLAGEHAQPVSAVAFARDGRLASGDWFGTIRIWAPGAAKAAGEIEAHLGRIDALAWNGKQLASAASDFQVKIWDIP